VPIVSIVFGGLLIALGLWGYTASEAKSVTALIPAFVGGLLAVLGVVALKESLLKHAMHAAAMVGLLGFLAAASRFVLKVVRGGAAWDDTATLATGGMTLLCLVFLGLCVNSFIQARRRRRAANEPGASAPG
jgi:sulfite exporter TauE/SafE